jgi:hypothetical protein
MPDATRREKRRGVRERLAREGDALRQSPYDP